MKKKIIFLNGPPGSGKDLTASFMVNGHGFKSFAFATPLVEITEALFPMYFYEDFKRNCQVVPNKSGRDFIIDLAESFIKPYLGKDFFALNLVDRIIMENDVLSKENGIVITDLGFQEELDVVIPKLRSFFEKEDIDSCFEIWHITRKGHTYSNDSRNYLWDERVNKIRVLTNDGSFSDLEKQVSSSTFSIEE